VPDALKARTVPLRMTKPEYRALAALLELTGVTIQEQLRMATKGWIAQQRQELKAAGVDFPSEIWLAEMTDRQFQDWLDATPGNRPKEPAPRKRSGLRTQPAAAA
jgi:hypothetical protein